MKLTRRQLRKLIKEMASFPVGIFDDIDYFKQRGLDSWKGMEMTAKNQFGHLGLTKMIMRYLAPHKDKLRLDIFWNDTDITVSLAYDNTEIGETSATENASLTGDTFFSVRWGATLEGERDTVKKSPRYNHIDKVFKEQGGYGPITYEIAIEYLSLQGEALTADRDSVSEDAYDLWEYYFKNRPDVQNRLIDFDESKTGFNAHNPTLYTAESWYTRKTKKHSSKAAVVFSILPDIQPELTDEELRDQYINYLKTESPLTRVYSKNTQTFLQAVRDLGILYINNNFIKPGQEIK